MEFHQLRYFIAAAEELSMSRAAERVHVSQPALSRQIAQLEEELGLLLFERIRKRIHLTPAGEFFLKKSRRLLHDSDLAVQQLRDQFGATRQCISLGFIGTFLDDLITPVVREFQQRHPRIKVHLIDLAPTEQVKRLRDKQIDIAILANINAKDRKEFSVEPLSTHRFDIVLPSDHPRAGSRSIRLDALSEEPWVSLADTHFPGRREFFVDCCAMAGFEPRIVSEQESLPLMLAAIATGTGVGLLPHHAAKIPHSGCRFLTLKAPAITTDLLAVTRNTTPDQSLATLMALIKEQAQLI